MHGQIGKDTRHGVRRHGPDFYYDNRAAMLARRRLLGNGTIDYDFRRERARAMRTAAIRDFCKRTIPATLAPMVMFVKALIAIAIVIAAILVTPADPQNCSVCADSAAGLAAAGMRLSPADSPVGLY